MFTLRFPKLQIPRLPRGLFKSIDAPGDLPPGILIHCRGDKGSGEGIFQVRHGGREGFKSSQAECASAEGEVGSRWGALGLTS